MAARAAGIDNVAMLTHMRDVVMDIANADQDEALPRWFRFKNLGGWNAVTNIGADSYDNDNSRHWTFTPRDENGDPQNAEQIGPDDRAYLRAAVCYWQETAYGDTWIIHRLHN